MSSDLLPKAEELNKVLKRCCTIMANDNNVNRSDTICQREKEIKCLTNKVSYLQSKLKNYSKQVENDSTIMSNSECNDESYQLISDNEQMILLSIFKYLTVCELLQMQSVCKTWNKVSKHPLLWQHLKLIDIQVSNQILCRLAAYCIDTHTIHLQGLIPSPASTDENLQSYIFRLKASLEPGLNQLLVQCSTHITSLAISECSLLLTERSFWLISKYCTNLASLVYNSNEFPVTSNSLWSLANGCTGLKELHLYPSSDAEINQRFDDKCLQIIAIGFPMLQGLTIGGSNITVLGISNIGTALKYLTRLRIINGPSFTVTKVDNYINNNCFSNLEYLILDHTRITPQAILNMIETHPHLKILHLTVSINDYFPEQSVDVDKYKRIIGNLQDLASHFKYKNVFKLSHS